MMRKNIEKHISKILQVFRCWLPFPWHFRPVANLFRDLFFGTSGGYPLGSILASPGHPWSDSVDLLEDFSCKLAPNFREVKATNGTNHTLKTQQVRIQTNTPNQSNLYIYLIIYLFFRLSLPMKGRIKMPRSTELTDDEDHLDQISSQYVRVPLRILASTTLSASLGSPPLGRLIRYLTDIIIEVRT